jgi:hypothetical protein
MWMGIAPSEHNNITALWRISLLPDNLRAIPA